MDEPLPCAEKQGFTTQREAWTAATVLRFQRGLRLKAYRCRHCQLYHLASHHDENL